MNQLILIHKAVKAGVVKLRKSQTKMKRLKSCLYFDLILKGLNIFMPQEFLKILMVLCVGLDRSFKPDFENHFESKILKIRFLIKIHIL